MISDGSKTLALSPHENFISSTSRRSRSSSRRSCSTTRRACRISGSWSGGEGRMDEREREREGSGFFFGRFVRPSTSRRRNPPPDPDLSSHVFLPLCILSRSPRTSNHSPSRLEDLGHGVGASLLELLCWRERGGKRTPTALDALKFAHSSLWRALFGRQAKDLEQSNTVSGSVSFSLFRFRFFLSFYREETEQAGEDGERGVDRKERERGRPRSEKKRGAEKGKKRKKARNSKQLGPKKLKKKNRPRTST